MTTTNSLKQFLRRKGGGTLAVVDGGWGDSGKGKLVDYFAGDVDVVARGTGGANAGHTIVLNGKTFIFHLVPAGILRDSDGVINIIGSGVAIDPAVLVRELKKLESEGMTYANLRISKNAKLVLPQHILLDRLRESAADGKKIGTTGRGIGPVYEDHVARIGLVMNDLLNPESFRSKFEKNLHAKRNSFDYPFEITQGIIFSTALRSGLYGYTDESRPSYLKYPPILNEKVIEREYFEYAKTFGHLICDTDDLLVKKQQSGARILLEGAQGVLLSVDYGSYPYVTSSDPTLAGLVRGVGLRDRDVDLTLNVVKAFYTTRVGDGPFPTELGGAASRYWCASHSKSDETEKFPHTHVNYWDPFLQGVGIRVAGSEYGATTGRPRRVGWFDIPLLRFSLRYASTQVVLTKLDVLDACKVIKIATKHIYRGPTYTVGSETLTDGSEIKTAIMDTAVLSHCEPVYAEFPGWLEPIGHIRSANKLPKNLMRIVRFIEKEAGVEVVMLSVGPDREQLIML